MIMIFIKHNAENDSSLTNFNYTHVQLKNVYFKDLSKKIVSTDAWGI